MEQATVTTNRRLERGDGPLGGVAAGMADYFDIDPTIVRLGLVATTLLGGPTIPIAYVAAWLIIPDGKTGAPSQGPATTAVPWAAAPPPPPAPPTPAPVPVPPAPMAEMPVDQADGAVDTADIVDEAVEDTDAPADEADVVGDTVDEADDAEDMTNGAEDER